MSSFTLKMVAVIMMFIDHFAAIFGDYYGWGFIPLVATFCLRALGRFSFPVFAFSLVNGWKHTSSKQNYFTNLCLCAVVSQVPYSLTNVMNRVPVTPGEEAFLFRMDPVVLAAGIFCAAACYVVTRGSKKETFIIAAVGLLPAFSIKIDNIWVLTGSLNTIYTLALGAVALWCIEEFLKGKQRKRLLYILFAIALICVYGPRADYGDWLIGLVLIAGLYFTQNYRELQSVVMILWGCLCYGAMQNNWMYAISVIVPALLIIKYDESIVYRGKMAKRIYYVFYPAHLFVLGLLNALIRLSP